MITKNIAIKANVVNGAEGIITDIKYNLNDYDRWYIICTYVKIDWSQLQAPGLPYEVVPILPVSTTFWYAQPKGLSFNITRKQIPLVPAYAYTDYKSQGRSLKYVIVDLTYCFSLQSVYVMLSRAKSLDGLAILHFFPPHQISQRLPEEFRIKFDRLTSVGMNTRDNFESVNQENLSKNIELLHIVLSAPVYPLTPQT